MANPHFQNLILWAGNTVASKSKKDLPMFQPYPSDQTYYGYFNDFMTYNSGDWTITTTEAGTGSATEAVPPETGSLVDNVSVLESICTRVPEHEPWLGHEDKRLMPLGEGLKPGFAG